MRTTLALLALLLAPAAAAQIPAIAPALTLTLAPPAGAIATETDRDVPFRIEYDVGPNAGALAVEVLATAPGVGWRVLPVPQRFATPDGPTLGGKHVFEGVIRVRHDGTPRAFAAGQVAVDVNAPGDGRAVPATSGEGSFPATADWRPGLFAQTSVAGVRLARGGGSETLVAELRNTGNADVKVSAGLARAPEGCTARASAPGTLAVDARGALRIDLVCERGWEPGSLRARLEHALPDGSRAGTPVEPSWQLERGEAGTTIAGGASFGDAPKEPRYNTPWGATLVAPVALAVAAALRRPRAPRAAHLLP